MNQVRYKKVSRLLVIAVFFLPLLYEAQDGEALFKQSCAACHTIGKGKAVGPDLKDVHTRRKEEWIIKFVKGSQAFIQSGDAEATAVFNENNKTVMPDQNLSDADIKSIIAYISSQSDGGAAPVVVAVDTAARKTSPALIQKGRSYFDGSLAFSNGGASCISCHNVNYPDMLGGGLLAKDLTKSFSRLGAAGIGSFITSPPTAMGQAFKDKPVTPEEADALVAFLQDVDKQNLAAEEDFDPLLLGGFAAFVVLFAGILLIWHKRKQRTVKKEIYDRQISSVN